MSARDLDPDVFSGALTRRDTAPTVLDAPAPGSAPPPTRLDMSPPAVASPTVLDHPGRHDGPGLAQLPSSLRPLYRIVRRLATAGAEADLFVVEPLATPQGQQRVVKLYRFGVAPKADVLARIRDADPQHLVRIFEFGESDGHWYEVMEYVAHGSLRQFMRGLPLPATNVVDLVRELAIGLEHLHGFGLIHRDLKPENILVREPMPLDLVITDFGISSLSDLSQRFTSANRTVRYAAPEALSGVIGKAVDYWSLGMIVAEAALGRHPLAELTDERAVTQWLTTRPIDLAGLADARVQTLCRGLLLRDPAQRWGGAEIARWLAGDATLAAPSEPAPPASATTTAGDRCATTPYLIGGEECWTAGQLGVALAKHWDTALRDLGRGLLRKWCEKELPSVAIERLFMDLEESSADPNDKLLDLILYLCPDIPPVYRGESLASRAAIAALVERASSSAESAPHELSRAVVRQIRAGLLSRFRIDAHPELRDVQRRLAELDIGLEAGHARVSNDTGWKRRWSWVGEGENTDSRAHRIDDDAVLMLEVALAVDPGLGDRIRAEARSFAASTEFRFWFHEYVDRAFEPSSPIRDAIARKEMLAMARRWYERNRSQLWGGILCEEPLRRPWETFIERVDSGEKLIAARRIAASVRAFDVNQAAIALHDLTRHRLLPLPRGKWTLECLELVAQAVHRCNEGDDSEVQAWLRLIEHRAQLQTNAREWADRLSRLPRLPKSAMAALDGFLDSAWLCRGSGRRVALAGLAGLEACSVGSHLERSERLHAASLGLGIDLDALDMAAADVNGDQELANLGASWSSWCAGVDKLVQAIPQADSVVADWRERASAEMVAALQRCRTTPAHWKQWCELIRRLKGLTEPLDALGDFIAHGRTAASGPWTAVKAAVLDALGDGSTEALDTHRRLASLVGLVHLDWKGGRRGDFGKILQSVPAEDFEWRTAPDTAFKLKGFSDFLDACARWHAERSAVGQDVILDDGQILRRKFAPVFGPLCRPFAAQNPESVPDQRAHADSLKAVSVIDDMYLLFESAPDGAIRAKALAQPPDGFWLLTVLSVQSDKVPQFELQLGLPVAQAFKPSPAGRGPLMPATATSDEIRSRSVPFKEWLAESKRAEREKARSEARTRRARKIHDLMEWIFLPIRLWSLVVIGAFWVLLFGDYDRNTILCLSAVVPYFGIIEILVLQLGRRDRQGDGSTFGSLLAFLHSIVLGPLMAIYMALADIESWFNSLGAVLLIATFLAGFLLWAFVWEKWGGGSESKSTT